MSRRGEFPFPLALGLIAGLLLGVAIGYLALSSQIGGLQSQVSTLQSQVASLQTQVGNLTSDKNLLSLQVSNLTAQKSVLESKVTTLELQMGNLTADKLNLTEQVENLTKAKLVFIDLHSSDVRPGTGSPYLQVTCFLCNVGSRPATGAKLDILLLQAGDVVANYTAVQLDTIAAEGWVSVDTKVYYSGSALVTWNIVPSWTS